MSDLDTRKWLRANQYEDIADMIDEVMKEWKAHEKRTRRNWWIVLAGGRNGRSLSQAGRTFPVLRSAQIRQGKPITANAICRNLNEAIPPIVPQKRWQKA